MTAQHQITDRPESTCVFCRQTLTRVNPKPVCAKPIPYLGVEVLKCTRPSGHAGGCIACGVGEHGLAASREEVTP